MSWDAVAPSGYERAATLPPSYVTGNPHTHTSTATRSAQPNTGIIHANDDGSSAIHPLLHRSNPQQRDGTSCSMPPAACMPEDIQRVSAFFGGVHFSPDLWANLRVCLRFGADAGRRRTFGTRGDRMLKLIVSTAEDILEENREMLGGSFQPPTKLIETDAELGKWAQSRMGDLTTGHLAGDEVRAYAGLFKGVCYFVYRSVGEAGTARALKYIGLGSEVST
ncbi:hypothetical protein CBOM_01368 [Ceraceosorus bombacis]|uniref:Uncharacterized protein n=1 Tax=Ceraceosorus bombacis TaxID=401625 RepID=A0A0P1BCB2_9BASI|nr:hypothetical protein CBOM_01368 [Ceraceosorus bombacis]